MFVCWQLEGSDRSGSSQSLRHLQTSTTSNRPQSENQTNNQSPNKVTRSQSATSSGTRGQRRHSHGGDHNNAHGSMKRKPDSLAFVSYKPFQCSTSVAVHSFMLVFQSPVLQLGWFLCLKFQVCAHLYKLYIVIFCKFCTLKSITRNSYMNILRQIAQAVLSYRLPTSICLFMSTVGKVLVCCYLFVQDPVVSTVVHFGNVYS